MTHMTAAHYTKHFNTLSPADQQEYHARCKADPSFHRMVRGMAELTTASAHAGTASAAVAVQALGRVETVPLSRNLMAELKNSTKHVIGRGAKRIADKVALRRPAPVVQ
jgi:hypothetical protein